MTTVHVTVLDLDSVPEDGLRDGLTAGDVATAAHVRNERRRRRLLAARRAFRVAAADLAGCAPAAVVLGRGLDGRPLAVTGGHIAAATHERYCAIVTANGRPAAADLKQVSLGPPSPALVSFLPEQARTALATVPADDLPREFALWWCRLEAAARVCGAGLDDGARCLESSAHQAEVIGPGLAVAVAVPGREPLHVRWTFSAVAAGAVG
jgi:hypothetical protein